jgi:hypothetical protein
MHNKRKFYTWKLQAMKQEKPRKEINTRQIESYGRASNRIRWAVRGAGNAGHGASPTAGKREVFSSNLLLD